MEDTKTNYWPLSKVQKMTGLHLQTIYRDVRLGILPTEKRFNRMVVSQDVLEEYIEVKGK